MGRIAAASSAVIRRRQGATMRAVIAAVLPSAARADACRMPAGPSERAGIEETRK
jgi:hypothetical protein